MHERGWLLGAPGFFWMTSSASFGPKRFLSSAQVPLILVGEFSCRKDETTLSNGIVREGADYDVYNKGYGATGFFCMKRKLNDLGNPTDEAQRPLTYILAPFDEVEWCHSNCDAYKGGVATQQSNNLVNTFLKSEMDSCLSEGYACGANVHTEEQFSSACAAAGGTVSETAHAGRRCSAQLPTGCNDRYALCTERVASMRNRMREANLQVGTAS